MMVGLNRRMLRATVTSRVANILLLVTVMATTVVLSGCSHSSDTDASTTLSSPASKSSDQSSLSEDNSAATHQSSLSADDRTKECLAGTLKAEQSGGQGAAGSVYESIAFKNTGKHSCTLSGSPGIQRIAANGQPIPPKIMVKKGGSLITLKSGQSAYLVIGLTNLAPDGSPYEPKRCKAVELGRIEFALDGQSSSVSLAHQGYGCTTGVDKLEVQPFSTNKPS